MGKGVFPIDQGFFYKKTVKERDMVKKELLDILACPRCHEKVALSDDGGWLICESCSVKYPIEGDIPIMLTDRSVGIDRR